MPTIKYKNNIVEVGRSVWAALLIKASFCKFFSRLCVCMTQKLRIKIKLITGCVVGVKKTIVTK